MIAALLEFSLRQRILVLGLTCLLSVAGVFAFQSIPIDAYPDVTNIQVQVLTEAPGLSPVEVERFITYPLELQMTGLPGLAEIRSLSKFALSQITVVFNDDVDMYFARQLVLERIMAAKERLPEGLEPVMAPVTTGLGEVYHYYVEGPNATATDPTIIETELTDQRTMQDWVLRPLLKSVPGVIDVNGMGGFVKQYQVLVDPAKLRKFDLTLHDIYEAVAKNNANAGGNVLERHAERAIVRGLGLIKTLSDIESIIVKESGGTPVFVRDVAEVRIGHAVRHGAVVFNGEREVVIGTVLMIRGGNARQVVEAVKTKVDDLQQTHILPAGTKLLPFYDRIELVSAAIDTVRDALIEGIVLVVFVFFFFLGHVRSAVVVTVSLIVTPLITFIVMQRMGLSANLMTLGGLAIAIGEIADGSLVVVENVYRHLAQNNGATKKSTSEVILQATKEVGRPILFGILIISVVFLPLMTLHGMEGKMFAPLAYTLVIALLASVVVTLTLSPVLASLLLRGDHPEETRLTRWMKQRYVPVLQWTLRRRSLVLTSSTVIVLCSLALVPFVGREFIPLLEEGALTPQVVRLPSVSLAESIEMEKQTHKAMLEFPEVKMAVSRIGRAEIPYHPEDLYESDPIVSLHDRSTWKTAKTQVGVDRCDPPETRRDPWYFRAHEPADSGTGGRADLRHQDGMRHQAVRRGSRCPARQGEGDCRFDAADRWRQRYQGRTDRRPALSHRRHRPAEDRPLRHQRGRRAGDHHHRHRRQGGDPCLRRRAAVSIDASVPGTATQQHRRHRGDQGEVGVRRADPDERTRHDRDARRPGPHQPRACETPHLHRLQRRRARHRRRRG